ncbi:PREDICTED: KH domain-containing protein HEN4-like [Tarenaya hassleriana]|uniref:KH domain-containing protein HEN4-like n=1 Tax=Tarenaya hassleriana TaxID=28532 RepID=UPI00053C3D0B|nr:PREDICTED: KH domain-containing protein HEN4-like [Tarenaya hassleriana]
MTVGMSSSPSKRLCNQGSIETNGTAKRQKSSSNFDKNHPLKSISDATFFRLLCPASKIGKITGEEEEDGSFLSQVFRETGMEVRVEDPIQECEERVIVIKGSGKVTELDADRKGDDREEVNTAKTSDVGKEQDGREKKMVDVPDSKSEPDVSSCVQKALFLLVERIAELKSETDEVDMGKEKRFPCLVRLIVLSSQVCYILGKGGNIVQRMSRGSGAQIRILPKDKHPSCVLASDDIVQIAGDADAVKKAIQSVSEQLLGNPPFSFEFSPANYASSSSHTSSKLARVSVTCRDPNISFGYQWSSHIAGPWDCADFPSKVMPPQEKLTFRLLCPDERVGWIIGKGGLVIKTLKHDTGCEIKILDKLIGSQDRVIIISGPAHPADRISPVQDAILRVQARIARATSDTKDKNAPARLIVSSNQVGFLLGKGGSNISEMRRLSGAQIHIRVAKIQKDVLEGDEIVQISGEHEAVQEALLLITTRLLHSFFLDAFPLGPHPMDTVLLDPLPQNVGGNGTGFSSPGRNSDFGPPLHKFGHFSGPAYCDGLLPHDFHSPSLHNIEPDMPPEVYKRKSRFPEGSLEEDNVSIVTSITEEVIVPSSLVPVIYGEDGACLKQICEFSDAKIIVTDPEPGATETVMVISGTPEQFHAAQSLIQAFVLSEIEVS